MSSFQIIELDYSMWNERIYGKGLDIKIDMFVR